MWKVRPRFLCNKHLLGEHVEMHMFAGVLRKKMNISGYLKNGLVEVHNIRKRHDELASEMLRRGMRHQSPLQPVRLCRSGKVDVENSMKVLAKRCRECRKRISKKSK